MYVLGVVRTCEHSEAFGQSVQETLKNKIMKSQKPSWAQFRKKRKEEEKKHAKEKGKSLNPVLAQNEFQIRKRSRMRELWTSGVSGVKKKRCTLSLKVFLLPVTQFFKDFTEAGISKMICPFILHYTKKDMIKIGAHI